MATTLNDLLLTAGVALAECCTVMLDVTENRDARKLSHEVLEELRHLGVSRVLDGENLRRSASRLTTMGEMLSRTEHAVVWTSQEEAFDAAQVIEEYHRAAAS